MPRRIAFTAFIVFAMISSCFVLNWIQNFIMEYPNHKDIEVSHILSKQAEDIRRRQDISYVLREDQEQIKNARLPPFTGVKTPNCVKKVHSLDKTEDLLIPNDATLKTFDNEMLDCLYDRYFRTQQYLCTNSLLLGGVGEGSWTVCDDVKYKSNESRVMIITNETQANKFLQYNSQHEYNLRIFVHGSTTKRQNKPSDGSDRVSITSLSNTLSATLQVLNDVGNNKKIYPETLILDDINRCSYLPFMKRITDRGYLKNFRQVVIRPPYPHDVEYSWKYLSILRRIYDQGFRIHHMEMNIEPYIPEHIRGHVLSYVNVDFQRTLSDDTTDSLPNIDNLDLQKLQNPGEYYYHYLISPQILCKKVIRIGSMMNGGWEVCHDDAFRPKHPCLIYSFGINYEFSFDDDSARTYGCEVHSFDPSMKGIPTHRRSTLVTFHDIGLADYDGIYRDWTMFTLKTLMKKLGHLNRTIDVLKMDIEWSEHSVIREMLRSGSLRHVKQLAWEIHTWRRNDTDTRYVYELSLLKQLYKFGFRIYWCHINHNLLFDAMDSGKRRSIAMEVYMINIRFRI